MVDPFFTVCSACVRLFQLSLCFAGRLHVRLRLRYLTLLELQRKKLGKMKEVCITASLQTLSCSWSDDFSLLALLGTACSHFSSSQ